MASFATFAVAFLARPLGSLLFGHLGDRVGRKSTLVATLLLMGLSTFAIGFLPGSDVLGIAAPVLLVLLRLLQGVGLAWEWAGAALLAAEYAPPGQRGRYAMFPQFGVGLYVPAFAVVTALSAVLSDRWGRRRLLLAGNAATLVWGVLLFPVVGTRNPVLIGAGLAVTLAVVALCYGPAGAYLPELFATHYRYTGAGVGYALAGILGGAVPPLLAASLQASYGSIAIGLFLSALGLLSLLCTFALRETATAGTLADLEPVTR